MKHIFKRIISLVCALTLGLAVASPSMIISAQELNDGIITHAALGASEEFLNSVSDSVRTTIYDGSSETENFQMNGRTYYQGLVFNSMEGYTYGREAYAQFNTENIDSLSFTIGHIDNKILSNATLTISLDGKGEDEISLNWNMNLMEYTLDVSKASVIQFYFAFDASGSYYGLADFKVDGSKINIPHSVPEYSSSENFMESGFNKCQMSVYDGTSKTDKFNMNGRTYYQGLVFNSVEGYTYGREAYAQFNTENIDLLSFTIGHIDNKTLSNATLTISLDGKGEDEISLNWNMNLMEYTLDVSNASVIRFYFSFDDSGLYYGLADFKVDGSKINIPHSVPEYSSSENFMESGFNKYQMTVYDGTSKTDNFSINGCTYYQGLVFNSNNNKSAYAQFNTEKLDTINFKLGHVDGKTSTSCEMTIIADNKTIETLNLTSDMDISDYSLDVKDISVIRFYFDYSTYSDSYALFDVSIKEKIIQGDVNNDGVFDVADAVMFQKWLVKSGKIVNWKAADLCEDEKLDVFDMVKMRKLLIQNK